MTEKYSEFSPDTDPEQSIPKKVSRQMITFPAELKHSKDGTQETYILLRARSCDIRELVEEINKIDEEYTDRIIRRSVVPSADGIGYKVRIFLKPDDSGDSEK